MPYLQALGPSSATVMWTGPRDDLAVDVTLPDGELVASAGAERDTAGDIGREHQQLARLDGLLPETVYCYSVMTPEGEPVFGRVGFKTGPAAETEGTKTRFVVLGDSGEGSDDQAALVEQIRTVPFDFMLHVGDMAYDTGTFGEFQAHYFDMYDTLLPHFSMFPVAGNHEYDTDQGGPFRAVFDLPNNERWYSFDWGDVHFVGLDTERIDSQKQREWLVDDLTRNRQPWTIAYLHKPPFSSGSHGSELDARKAFSPIFEKHDVDLVIAGHDHHYERTKRQNGVEYIVTGGGGAATYPVDPSDFSAFAEEVIHFVYVTVEGGALSAHAIDGSGQEFDQLRIRKDVAATQ